MGANKLDARKYFLLISFVPYNAYRLSPDLDWQLSQFYPVSVDFRDTITRWFVTPDFAGWSPRIIDVKQSSVKC